MNADGICHVYVDNSANIDMTMQIVRDAKIDYPTAYNAMGTLLVHKNLSCNGGLNELILELQREGLKMYGGPKACAMLNIVETSSFHHEYSSRTCTIEIVEDVFTAIDHINKHGSGHTECIVTEDSEVDETFISQVDSAAVFHNASTRFGDGARFGIGAEDNLGKFDEKADEENFVSFDESNPLKEDKIISYDDDDFISDDISKDNQDDQSTQENEVSIEQQDQYDNLPKEWRSRRDHPIDNIIGDINK
uniref:Delta-1-pyrroline-5-carboxylate synthase B-like n=1 Tax=Cicer arietinum TaxID=3827 RepID=A0A1S3EJ37_CICAR|nr:delta-1-pyrroline-5-carboxylate synthase B-like [Cicer arietinum]